MQILHLLAGRAEGGAEAFFERLALALNGQGMRQAAVIRPHLRRVNRLKAAGITVVTAPYRRYLDWQTPRAIRALAKQVRPDIILSWMSRASALCPALSGTHVARLGGYYDLKYYQRCDYLIANTPPLRDWIIRQGWPAERVFYLPNFVEAPVAGATLPDGLMKPAGKPLLLALGRLHRHKGFDTLLRAMAHVDAMLWLAGAGNEEHALKRLTRELGISGRVRFLGWQEAPSALYQAADIFICPSRLETLGNVVLEAWAHGLPVISTATAGPSYYIRPDEDGVIVPIDDAQTLAAAINGLLLDQVKATALGESGRQRYHADFTEHAVAKQYRHVLESLRS